MVKHQKGGLDLVPIKELESDAVQERLRKA